MRIRRKIVKSFYQNECISENSSVARWLGKGTLETISLDSIAVVWRTWKISRRWRKRIAYFQKIPLMSQNTLYWQVTLTLHVDNDARWS